MENNHKIYGDVVGVPIPPIDSYTKKETDKLLANKVSKEDIVSAYKFCGSVDTFDEELMTPATYEIIPKGNPTYNGVVVGTYDAENRTVTIDSTKLEGWDGYDVKVQIEPITISKGFYSFDVEVGVITENGAILINGYFCDQYAWEINDTMTISEVSIGTQGYSYSGTHPLGNLLKYSSVEIEDSNGTATGFAIVGSLETGNVYNVLDSGMNYAWTGTEWDALGGEHRDMEAREQIEALSTTLEEQTGDIETALDSIIEIQNSLIGGDGV